jgi:hypothetical protein
MKKLFIGFVLVAFVVLNGCKKEEKNPTKTTSGDEGSATSMIKNLFGGRDNAIKKGEDEKYTFSLALEKDEVYQVNSISTSEQTIQVNGQKNSGENTQSTHIDFTVKEITDTGYKMEVKFKSISLGQKANGKEVKIDTNQKEPEQAELKTPWKMQKSITNIPFMIELSKQGKVNSVTGLEAIYKNVEKEFQKIFKPQELQMIVGQIKQSLNEEMLKKQLEDGVSKFPTKSISIGDSWNDESNVNGTGLKQKYTYKLVGVEDGVAEISVVGVIKENNEQTDPKSGAKQSLSMNGNTVGKIIYDTETGWIKSSTSTENIKGKQSMRAGSNAPTQTMEMLSKRVSKINEK